MKAAQLWVPRRRVAVLAAVLGSAAALAPPAVADIQPVPTAAVLPDAAAIGAAALAAAQPAVTPSPELALPAPTSAVAPAPMPVPPEPESVPPADPATAAPLESATQAPVVAAPVDTPAEAPVAVPDPPPATVVAPIPVQETPEQGVETVAQAVQQIQPVNVNVSVRVDSPGDNGVVTQINAALAVPPPVTVPPEARYQAPEPQYQDVSAPSGHSAVPDAPGGIGSEAASATVPTEAWDWTWTWSCGEAIAPSIVLPANYLQQIWNWNWNWNCDGKNDGIGNTESQLPSQYQPVTSQYQPINVNVSIRIASPGNDGPVVQANVALAMPFVVAGVLPVAIRPVSVSVTVPAATAAPAESPAASVQAAPEPVEAPSTALQDGASSEQSPISATAGSDAAPIRSVLERDPKPDGRDTTAATTPSAPLANVSPEAIAALAPPAPAIAAGRRARAQEQRRQAHTRRFAPKHAAAGVISYASVVPLGAGGRDRTLLLVVLFLIPFLLAFADAARRVSEEWKAEAADSGTRRRKPG